ncbi:MAG: acyl carrier protein [Cyclobacteriaceae bacterium]|jgi:acyl carrier protein
MSDFIEKFSEALEMEMHDIKPTDEFRNLEGWDSLSRLSLIAMLDEEYNIQIEDEDFEKLKTVEDIMKTVQK